MFKIPSVVAKKIVKLQRNFLLGWRFDERKIAWMSWEKVCEPLKVCVLVGEMDLEVGFFQRWFVEGGVRFQVWRLEKPGSVQHKQGSVGDEGMG